MSPIKNKIGGQNMDLIVKEYLGSNVEFKMINGNVYANATSMARIFDKEVRS